MTEAKIYVGLNDATIRKQLYETDRYISILKNICVAITFSSLYPRAADPASMRTANIPKRIPSS